MANIVSVLGSTFWRICLLRLGPQDLPRSSALLGLTVLVNLVLSLLINQRRLPLTESLILAGLEIAVLAGLTGVLLSAFSRAQRLVQTLSALMGSGAMIGLVALVMLSVFPALSNGPRIAIFVWNLLVIAHVLRHALEIQLFLAFLVAIGYAIILIQIVVAVGQMLPSAS